MFISRKRICSLALGAALVTGGIATGIAPANAAVCGFEGVTSGNIGGGNDGKYEAGNYNHCGEGNTKIQIDYVYANEKKCVTPGVTQFAANPNLGAITNIFSIGTC